jgi:hypothetical protein
MSVQEKQIMYTIIISLLSAILLLLSNDREVIYNEQGFPVVMVDGEPLMPEDMR